MLLFYASSSHTVLAGSLKCVLLLIKNPFKIQIFKINEVKAQKVKHGQIKGVFLFCKSIWVHAILQSFVRTSFCLPPIKKVANDCSKQSQQLSIHLIDLTKHCLEAWQTTIRNSLLSP